MTQSSWKHTALRLACGLTVAIAVLAIVPSMISGVGFAFTAVSLLMAAVVGACGATRCAWVAMAINAVSTFGLSVYSVFERNAWSHDGDTAQILAQLLVIGLPFALALLGVAFGQQRAKRSAQAPISQPA